MDFLDHVTASDWVMILVLDAAVFLLGIIAGQESVAVKEEEKPGVK